MHSLCEVVGQAAPTQLPPVAGNFPELHVAPLPVQGRVYSPKRQVCVCTDEVFKVRAEGSQA